MYLNSIREGLGSILSRVTGYFDWGSSALSFASPGRFLDSTSAGARRDPSKPTILLFDTIQSSCWQRGKIHPNYYI
jgi:hypothetical protein